jgi:hypothetical protein
VAAKIAGLKKVIAHLNRLGRMGQVVSIDLNSADGAVVSFRNGDMSSSSVQASGAWSDTRSGV